MQDISKKAHLLRFVSKASFSRGVSEIECDGRAIPSKCAIGSAIAGKTNQARSEGKASPLRDAQPPTQRRGV